MSVSTIILFMVLCLMMEAFFAGSEIAVVSADRLKLRHQAAKGSRGAQLALDMLKTPEWLLSTTLVGINVAIVTNTSLATLLAIDLMGQDKAWVAIAIVAPLIWVFGEIVPKSIFQQKADVLTPRIIYVLKGASWLFFPIILIFTTVVNLVTRLFGGGMQHNPFTLREEIDMALQMKSAETDILPVEKSMIRRLFNFGETKARDIMIPLIEVRAVEQSATRGQALRVAGEHAHLLLPVYVGRVDRIVGCVHAIDLMEEPESHPIKTHIKPVRYVPGSKSIEDLLTAFREEGDRLAIVVDEYGGCEGLVALEDIMERVVGEMRDEYDVVEEKATTWWRQTQPGRYQVNPRITLVALRDELGVALPDGSYETLGGFLLDRFQEIPREGASWKEVGVEFVVTRAGASVIREVQIKT
ncbi:MAG: HlyC/CorC family transporter [Magnetococcales bacterium]|nr:HlyC/CorC family transporter [Magnetococcales bacterium]